MIDLTTQRIVVTGGAGFLGKFVCKKLCQRGVPSDQLLVPRSTLYDLTTEDGVVRMYDDFEPDIVIHLQPRLGVSAQIWPNRAVFSMPMLQWDFILLNTEDNGK